ncbi:MAG: beta-propeller fold lactonase family protein [Actinomycetota bacterium]|nr:beta-propeller fold lactonase family protein [Actinomycetota bacterium]
MNTNSLPEQLATVDELRGQAQSGERDVAVTARASLVRLIAADNPEVSAAARQAVRETSISLVPPRIDFGPVAPGTPRLSAAIKIGGAPIALTSTIKVTGAGLRARIAGGLLQVQWLPGDGPLTGMVSLDGPAGAADLPVTGHISAARTTFDRLEAEWPPAAAEPSESVWPSGGAVPSESVWPSGAAVPSETVWPSGAAVPSETVLPPGAALPLDTAPPPETAQPAKTGTVAADDAAGPVPTATFPTTVEPIDGELATTTDETGLFTPDPWGADAPAGWPGERERLDTTPPSADQRDVWPAETTPLVTHAATTDDRDDDEPYRWVPLETEPAPRGGWAAGDRAPAVPPPSRTRRRGKGLIIAGATALVLLAGTGLAAAVTLRNDQSSPTKQEQVAQPPANQQGRTGGSGDNGGDQGSGAGRGDETGSGNAGQGNAEQKGNGQAVPASLDKPAVAGTIEVGDEPEGVAVSPDSRTLYVANQNSRILSVADLQSGQVRNVTLRNTPRFVTVSQDGRRVFVSMYEDDLSGSGVAVVDAQKLTVLRNLRTGVQPYALAVAPDGRLWVPIHGGRNVEIYESEKLTGRVFVPENPHAVSFGTDGQRAFTPDHESSTVSVIDTRNDKRLKSIPVSAAPHSLAVSPDGRTVVVACFQANAVDLIDTGTLERRGPFKVGRKPQAAAFAVDSGHAYAVNEAGNSVSVIDPASGKVTATVPVGRSPRTMAVAPNGKFAYVSNGGDDTVTILRVS